MSLLAHHFGISPETYAKYSKLAEAFQILSTMTDLDGKEFVAMIESKKYPIYAVQFHPEVNPFDFSKPVYPHFSSAIAVSSYFSEFLVSLSRKNTNKFPSSLLLNYSIYNYPVFYDKNSRTTDFLF